MFFVALAIMGTMRMEYDHRIDVVPPLQYGEFDQKIDILYGRMGTEVINVLRHVLSFVKSFSWAHNMVDLMLDPHFKGMDCIMDYIGRDQAAILL